MLNYVGFFQIAYTYECIYENKTVLPHFQY